MSHARILECLELNINRVLWANIKNSMGPWKTTPQTNSDNFANVIHQVWCIQNRSSVSDVGKHRPKPPEPLKSVYGFRLHSWEIISYFLKMDDIKCLSERDSNCLINIIRTGSSSTVTMTFRLDKCCRIVTKRGKVVRTKWITLPEGNVWRTATNTWEY